MTHPGDDRRGDRARHLSAADARDETTYPIELALLEVGHETGFRDDNQRPAPRPDDIDEWSPSTHEPLTLQSGEPPF